MSVRALSFPVFILLGLAWSACGDSTGGAGGAGGGATKSSSSTGQGTGGSGGEGHGATCGDVLCEPGESCDTCEQDCGKCYGWCGQGTPCNPFESNDCGAGAACEVAVDFYHGDPHLSMACFQGFFMDYVNQPVGEPCGNVDFGVDGTCAAGLLCVDPTPFYQIQADDPPSVYDARCRKACCDDSDCGAGKTCKKFGLQETGSLGYCP